MMSLSETHRRAALPQDPINRADAFPENDPPGASAAPKSSLRGGQPAQKKAPRSSTGIAPAYGVMPACDRGDSRITSIERGSERTQRDEQLIRIPRAIQRAKP